MHMKADLIIFDLDGTIMNSIPDLTNAINCVADQYSFSVYSEDKVGELVGGGVVELVEKAFNTSKNDINFSNYYDLFMEHYGKNHSNCSHLFDGVIEVLEHFETKKLAILSNKLQMFTEQMAKDYDIYRYFDIILGATDGMAKKPSSEPIDFIVKRLGGDRKTTIMVGDSEPDIQTAKNSGIRSVAVTYGYRTKEQLSAFEPDRIIDKITDLITIIK